MISARRIRRLGRLAVVALAATPRLVMAQEDDAHRDAWQRTSDVADVLGAVPGARVADIGAGGGYFTHRLLARVGAEGRVYAVDISRNAVARLRRTLEQQGVRNVDVILGQPDDPRLPFESLDGALIVNAYHEMTEYQAMLEYVRQALRPGGRLVILDNPPGDTTATRDVQTGQHQIHIGLVAAELREAGFEILDRDPGFVSDTSDGHRHFMWMIAARRPLHDPPVQRFAGAAAGPEGLFACPFTGSAGSLAERPSPPDSVESRIGSARLKVCYSRPAMRGRTIMGGLLSYGTPWGTGANEATVLRTDRPVEVGGIRIEPGWYSIYTVPGPEAWTVVINGLAARNAGPIDEWVRSQDVGRFEVPVEETEEPVERLTFRFEPAEGGATLVIEWDRTHVRIPVR